MTLLEIAAAFEAFLVSNGLEPKDFYVACNGDQAFQPLKRLAFSDSYAAKMSPAEQRALSSSPDEMTIGAIRFIRRPRREA